MFEQVVLIQLHCGAVRVKTFVSDNPITWPRVVRYLENRGDFDACRDDVTFVDPSDFISID